MGLLRYLPRVQHVLRTEGPRILVGKILRRLKATPLTVTKRPRLLTTDSSYRPFPLPPVQAPAVSIVIPVYGQYRYTFLCLASLRESAGSSGYEVIVVDDGSSDDTARIAAGISDLVTVITQANTGCGAACSRAIRQTRQPIVATVDADDLWLPEKMEKQLAVLGSDDDRRLVFARHRQFHHGKADDETGAIRDGITRSDLVMRRAVFDQIGDIIDPPGGRGDMIDWLARAREAGCQFVHVDEVLVLRRIIKGSLSYGRDREKDRGYLAVAYRAMQRRKQNMPGGDT